MNVPVITLDGPSGVGKGTLTRKLAAALGWHFLDSGAIYRLLALAAERQGISPEDETALLKLAAELDIRFEECPRGDVEIFLNGEPVTQAIRADAIGAFASRIAVLAPVRDALLERQRQFRQAPGLVADGRDMGTVVFPEATLKIFLTATAEERAKRRANQLRGQNVSVNLEQIQRDIETRDLRDSSRAVAPLKPAADAIIVDTTGQGIDESFASLWPMVKTAVFRSTNGSI